MANVKCPKCGAQLTVAPGAVSVQCTGCGTNLRLKTGVTADANGGAPTTAPAAWHYVDAAGAQQGPVAKDFVVQLIRAGRVNANTLVWREGMGDWMRICDTELWASAAPSPAIGAAPAYGPAPGYGAAAMTGGMPTRGDEVYQPTFDINTATPAEQAYWRSWRPTTFSVGGAVTLDIITCGIFGMIYYGLKFGEIPKVSRNDFGAGQGIGFMFIPYFHWYWWFRFWQGLCDRINLQIRVTNPRQALLPRGLATTLAVLNVVAILGAIPFIGLFIGLPIALAEVVCRAVFVAKMQGAINTIAAAQSGVRM